MEHEIEKEFNRDRYRIVANLLSVGQRMATTIDKHRQVTGYEIEDKPKVISTERNLYASTQYRFKVLLE